MGIVKSQLVRGIFYTALARYAGVIVQLCVTAILARLLSPVEFGIIAICTVVVAFFHQFTEMGIGVAVIQRQDLTQDDYDHLHTFSIYFGLFLGALFCIVAYPVSNWYSQDNLSFYLQLLSLQLVFSSFNIIPNALLMKAKRFKFVAIRTLSIQISTGMIACIAAYQGCGIYSLLVNPILSSIGSYIVNRNSVTLSFRIKFDSSPLRKVFTYSFYQFAFGIVNYFSRNLDKILTGKYISMNELGFYEKSYRLVLLPMQYVPGILNQVVQPVLAEYQNDRERLGSYLLRILRVLNMICFPVSIAAFFCAKEIIILFFGNQWYAAVPCFQILCFSIGFQSANHITGAFYQVANSTKMLFWTGLLCAIENILGFIIAISIWHSIEAVAIAVSMVYFFAFFQNYIVLFHVIYRNMLPAFFKSLMLPFIVSCLTALALLPTMMIQSENLWLTILCKQILFGFVLLLSYHFTGFLTWKDVKQHAIKLKNKFN